MATATNIENCLDSFLVPFKEGSFGILCNDELHEISAKYMSDESEVYYNTLFSELGISKSARVNSSVDVSQIIKSKSLKSLLESEGYSDIEFKLIRKCSYLYEGCFTAVKGDEICNESFLPYYRCISENEQGKNVSEFCVHDFLVSDKTWWIGAFTDFGLFIPAGVHIEYEQMGNLYQAFPAILTREYNTIIGHEFGCSNKSLKS